MVIARGIQAWFIAAGRSVSPTAALNLVSRKVVNRLADNVNAPPRAKRKHTLDNEGSLLTRHVPTICRHYLIFKFAKYPSVPGPTHKATPPSESPSFKSLTIRQGCAAPCTNSRAFVPSTTMRYFVQMPGPGPRTTRTSLAILS